MIAGYYGFGNAGDELLLRSLIDQFRNQDPQREVIVLSNNPDETSRHFSIRAVNRWKPWAWIGPFSQARRLLLGRRWSAAGINRSLESHLLSAADRDGQGIRLRDGSPVDRS